MTALFGSPYISSLEQDFTSKSLEIFMFDCCKEVQLYFYQKVSCSVVQECLTGDEKAKAERKKTEKAFSS